MSFGGVLFGILFAFLSFIFLVFLISLFKKSEVGHDFLPGISIVIPAYNEAKRIAGCIAAIAGADYPKDRLEIIVVDDGSADDTRNIVAEELSKLEEQSKVRENGTREIVAAEQQIRLIAMQHKGKVDALNEGCKAATRSFILTVDADTVVEKNCLKRIVQPLFDPKVGAVTGTCSVKNADSWLGAFQSIEYHYNNLIRKSFSKVFSNGIWFFGALACYRKSALEKVGFFKKQTLAEDMDIALELRKAGYAVIHADQAFASTVAPVSIRGLAMQRSRWWIGVLQSLFRNRSLITKDSSASTRFLYLNQYWWTGYAFLSFPLIAYQVWYWLPLQDGLASVWWYLFRWFSLSGPLYVLLKIPEWGISFYSIFGVAGGLISTLMILAALNQFKERISFRNALAVFFYFPYTILLNSIIVFAIGKEAFRKDAYFIAR